ncbi:MAG: WD40 repeat domain-containing protein [Polyangiaceae bacterium]|nr:WD40 repeat domain-containing protein [Polyangiaceae bacterium]
MRTQRSGRFGFSFVLAARTRQLKAFSIAFGCLSMAAIGCDGSGTTTGGVDTGTSTASAVTATSSASAAMTASETASSPVGKPPSGDELPKGAIRRFGSTQFGHGDTVLSVAFSPDSTTLLAGDARGVLIAWDPNTGAKKGAYTEVADMLNDIRGVVYSPDGSKIAFVDQKGRAHLLDAKTLKKLKEQKVHEHSGTSIAFSPNGKKIATGGFNPMAAVWDLDKDQVTPMSRASFPEERAAELVQFSSDGKTLFAGGDFGGPIGLFYGYGPTNIVPPVVKLDPESGKELGTLKGPRRISTIVMSPADRRVMAVGTLGGNVIVREVESGDKVGGIDLKEPVFSIAFSPDGAKMAVGAADSGVRVFESKTGKLVCTLEAAPSNPMDLAYSADGKRIAAAGSTAVYVADAESCKPVLPSEGHRDEVRALSVSPDGKLIVTGDTEGFVVVWDRDTGKVVTKFKAHDRYTVQVAVSPDGKVLATSTSGNMVSLWKMGSWEKLASIKTDASVFSISFSADSSVLAAAQYEKKDALLMDVPSGKVRGRVTLKEGSVQEVTFLPNGVLAAVTEQPVTPDTPRYAVRFFDPTTKEEKRRFDSSGGSRLVVSADGNSLVTISGGMVHVFDGNGARKKELEGWSNTVAFSGDSKLVSVWKDGVLTVWDKDFTKKLASLPAADCELSNVAAVPNTNWVVTSLVNGTVLLWDMDKVGK